MKRALTCHVTAGLARGDSPNRARVRVVFEGNEAIVETLDGAPLPGRENWGHLPRPDRQAVAYRSDSGWRWVGEHHPRLDTQWQRTLSALYARSAAAPQPQ